MNHFLKWLNMGGYYGYVWSAYTMAFLMFICHGLAIKWQKRRTRQLLAQWYKRWSP